MELKAIQGLAKSQHINFSELSKADLIRTIQTKEGNFDCYATAYSGECDQEDCLWREDCFEAARQGELS